MKYLLFTASLDGEQLGTYAVKSPFGNVTQHTPQARKAYPTSDQILINVIEDGASRMSKPEGLKMRMSWK